MVAGLEKLFKFIANSPIFSRNGIDSIPGCCFPFLRAFFIDFAFLPLMAGVLRKPLQFGTNIVTSPEKGIDSIQWCCLPLWTDFHFFFAFFIAVGQGRPYQSGECNSEPPSWSKFSKVKTFAGRVEVPPFLGFLLPSKIDFGPYRMLMLLVKIIYPETTVSEKCRLLQLLLRRNLYRRHDFLVLLQRITMLHSQLGIHHMPQFVVSSGAFHPSAHWLLETLACSFCNIFNVLSEQEPESTDPYIGGGSTTFSLEDLEPYFLNESASTTCTFFKFKDYVPQSELGDLGDLVACDIPIHLINKAHNQGASEHSSLPWNCQQCKSLTC